MRDLRAILPQRIVRKLGKMHHRIAALEICLGNLPKVLVQCLRRQPEMSIVAVEPAIAVITGIQSDHIETALHQHGRKNGPDVSIDARHKHAHVCFLPRRRL